MAEHSYHTIADPAEGIYREKGSRFHSFAYPVSSETDIKVRLDFLKRKHFGAQHHCYAWVLGPQKTRFRSFDDGEPNHSAGDPILGRIRSAGLTDILVVVVRYFGGVKLGVGGLVSAYKTATENVLAKVQVIEKFVTERLTLSFDYEATSQITRLLRTLDVKILEQHFGVRTNLVLDISEHQKQQILSQLELLKAIGKAIDWKFKSQKKEPPWVSSLLRY
jgi:uncharacterized YigZ family protein